MVYEYRNIKDFLYGTLSTAAAVSDTSLSSVDFTSLGSGWSAGNYLPIVLLDPSTKVHEKVWLTSHAADAETATVVRGRESTAPRAWPAGTQWIVAPTVRDALAPAATGAYPADPHVGMRIVMLDKGYAAERTYIGEWAPSTGVALGEQVGNRRNNVIVPGWAALQMRAGHASGTTDVDGRITVAYKVPFSTATVSAVVLSNGGTGAAVTIFSVPAETVNGFTVQAWRVSNLNPYTTLPVTGGVAFTFCYLAVGY